MSGQTLESELKFRADDAAALLRLAVASTLGAARLGAATTVPELDRYLDTAELRLAAAGWACRVRTRGGHAGLSLKGPAQHARGEFLHKRPELDGPVAAGDDPLGWPPSAARDRLLEMTGGRPIRERFTLDQLRTEREVTVGARRAGVLSLDRVTVRHAGTAVGDLYVVELELDPAAIAAGLDPQPLAAALNAEDGLRPDEKTKLAHALEMIAAASR